MAKAKKSKPRQKSEKASKRNKVSKVVKKNVSLKPQDIFLGLFGGLGMGIVSIWVAEALYLPQFFVAATSAIMAFVVCVTIWMSGFREFRFDDSLAIAFPIEQVNDMPWVNKNFATFYSSDDESKSLAKKPKHRGSKKKRSQKHSKKK